MWSAYIVATVVLSLPWPTILADLGLQHFLQRYDRIARQRPSLVIEAEVSERDELDTKVRSATITAVRPATLRIDMGESEKGAAQTIVLTDREWRMYDAKRGIAARRLTNPRVPFLGIVDSPSTHERIAAWVLFGQSRYASESFELRMSTKTEWYVHILGRPRDPKGDVRQMEVVFNRKRMTPARIWLQDSTGAQVTWLVKHARVDDQLTTAKVLQDLPPVDSK